MIAFIVQLLQFLKGLFFRRKDDWQSYRKKHSEMLTANLPFRLAVPELLKESSVAARGFYIQFTCYAAMTLLMHTTDTCMRDLKEKYL